MRHRVTYFFHDAPPAAYEVEAATEGEAIGETAEYAIHFHGGRLRAVEAHQLGASEGGIVRQNRMCPNCGESHLCSGEFDELPIPTENRLVPHG